MPLLFQNVRQIAAEDNLSCVMRIVLIEVIHRGLKGPCEDPAPVGTESSCCIAVSAAGRKLEETGRKSTFADCLGWEFALYPLPDV
jgi:hypothetical protein